MVVKQDDPAAFGHLLRGAMRAEPLFEQFPLAGVHKHRLFGKTHADSKRRIREGCQFISATEH